jgi:hypothetical protein
MSRRAALQLLLLVEAASFATAASIHLGILLEGYGDSRAGVAESVIAAVLLLGLALAVFGWTPTRASALAAQGFALAGTLVGVFTIAIGIGPRTTLDVAFHAAFVALLVFGLAAAARAPAQTHGSAA